MCLPAYSKSYNILIHLFYYNPHSSAVPSGPLCSIHMPGRKPRSARPLHPPFFNKWGNSVHDVRSADFPEDRSFHAAMRRVTDRIRVIDGVWRASDPVKREAEYPDLVIIGGPRRELILTELAQRKKCAPASP